MTREMSQRRVSGASKFVLAGTATLVLTVLGAPAGIQAEESSEPRARQAQTSDYHIQAKVEKRLRLEDDIQWRNLAVQVKDGMVTLNGMVRTMEAKGLATNLASTTKGVKALRNNIIVNPHLPPVGDEDGERSHVETITRDRVIEGHERIKDVQLMP